MMLEAREAARKDGREVQEQERQPARLPASRGRVDRHRALQAAFEEVTKDEPFKVIHTEYGANDPETGYEKGSQVIPKYKGQFDFLFISNQQAANGIIRALKENGIKPGKDVWIVSGDCSGSLEAVKNGETFGTGIQPAAVEGALAVRTAAKFVANDARSRARRSSTRSRPSRPRSSPPRPRSTTTCRTRRRSAPTGIAGDQDLGLQTADEICAGG